MEKYDHFCDYQIKRFLLQLVRGFSGFQYKTGRKGNTPAQTKLVPCMIAKRSRQAAAIQRNGSENTLNSFPVITIDHNGLRPDPTRLQNPGHVASVQAYLQKRDENGALTGERGNSVTIQKLMPRPFNMDIQVDVWTTNMDQKHQLMEQILTIIFPTFDIQNSDNALDWSALSTVQVKDVTWTSASYPIGSDGDIEVASITLEIPIWLNPPAKVLRGDIIEKVITNINDALFDDDGNVTNEGDTLGTVVVTPGNHHIKVSGTHIELLGAKANLTDADGNPFTWDNLMNEYRHALNPAQTQIRIKYHPDDEHEIIGLFQSATGNTLTWQLVLGSLPSNTLTAVNAVIDPRRSFPGDGSLPPAANGQRYLLIGDLPPNTDAWGAIGAYTNSIIERVNGAWVANFTGSSSVQYVVNINTSKQLRWENGQWSTALEGVFSPGTWRII